MRKLSIHALLSLNGDFVDTIGFLGFRRLIHRTSPGISSRLPPLCCPAPTVSLQRFWRCRNSSWSSSHKGVETHRVALSLLAQLDIKRPDELYASFRKVFDLSGKWDRGVQPAVDLAEISEAVDEAIALLNSPEFD
jgi:hypothetical protein